MKLDSFLIPKNINSSQNLNLRAKTIKCLGEYMGLNLCDLQLGRAFLGMIPKAQMTKEK